MDQIVAPQNITVDGTEYPVTGFSETVQRLVAIHTAWRNDLQDERLTVAKTEAALRSLEAEMSQAIQTELKAKADAAAAADAPTTADASQAAEAAADAAQAAALAATPAPAAQ